MKRWVTWQKCTFVTVYFFSCFLGTRGRDQESSLKVGSGEVEVVWYPRVVGYGGLGVRAAEVIPRRRVDFRYQDGMLVGVLPYYVSLWRYQPSFLPLEVVHAARGVVVGCGVKDVVEVDVGTMMARPRRVYTDGAVNLDYPPGEGDWSEGVFSYDGVGNLTGLAADGLKAEDETYTYDRLTRLVRWQRRQGATTLANESYGFDAFGNLTSYAGRTLATDPATNRLFAASYDASGNLTAWAGFSYT